MYCSGDLLIFHGTTWYSYLIEWFGGSRISHVGIYLHDPESWDGWDHVLVNKSSTNEYVMHSGYGRSAETGEMFFGVHIEPLEDVVKVYGESNIWVRPVHARRDDSWYAKFIEVHAAIHAKPYDTTITDWLSAEMRIHYPNFSDNESGSKGAIWYHRTDRFWCSAMVTYMYVRLGWIFPNVDWTLVAPFELTEQGKTLRWNVPVESAQLFANHSEPTENV